MGASRRIRDPDVMVEDVFQALVRGDLTRDDLTVRKLSARFGGSTIGLYHYFGSLDGFLIRVDGAGWRHLLAELERAVLRGGTLVDLALAYVAFAKRHPTLYWVMAERPFDRAALRSEGRLRQERPILDAFGALLARLGSKEPSRDLLLVFATLHGLASLVGGGRFDLGGAREVRERVEDAARDLERLFPR